MSSDRRAAKRKRDAESSKAASKQSSIAAFFQPQQKSLPPADLDIQLLSDEDEDEEEYDVEKVLDHRTTSDDEIEYHIKWLGYDEEQNTWEGPQNLNCDEKVKEYWRWRNKSKEGKALIAEILDPFCKKRASSSTSISIVRKSIHMALGTCSDSLSSSEKNKKEQKRALMEWKEAVNKICMLANEAGISIINDVDDELPPSDFRYVTSYKPTGAAANIVLNVPTLSCSCQTGECGKSDDCCPQLNEGAVAYRQNGRLLTKHKGAIYECNSGCKCDPKRCFNRVVQRGRQVKLQIFRTKRCGWGVRALKNIPANTFVTEYVGEILTTEEAGTRNRKKSKYLFDLDYDGEATYTVDAEKEGNIAHFINHSCDPNLVVRNVYVDCIDAKIPRLAFFTVRDVRDGDELTFDYRPSAAHVQQQQQLSENSDDSDDDGDDVNDEVDQPQKCFCGASNCRGKLIF